MGRSSVYLLSLLFLGLLLSVIFSKTGTSGLPDHFSCCECFRAPKLKTTHETQYTFTYTSSPLEQSWLAHKNDSSWLLNPCSLSETDANMSVAVRTWGNELQHPRDTEVFSQYVRSDNAIFFIEPLSFLLRHPLS